MGECDSPVQVAIAIRCDRFIWGGIVPFLGDHKDLPYDFHIILPSTISLNELLDTQKVGLLYIENEQLISYYFAENRDE